MTVKDKTGFTPREFAYSTAIAALEELLQKAHADFDLAAHHSQGSRYASEGEAKQIADQTEKLIEKLTKQAGFDR